MSLSGLTKSLSGLTKSLSGLTKSLSGLTKSLSGLTQSTYDQINEVSALKLTLHGRLIGYLAGFQNGRNVLSFTDEFKAGNYSDTRGHGQHSA